MISMKAAAAAPLLVLVLLPFISPQATAAQPAATLPQWQEVAPGVWKTVIGKPDELSLLTAVGVAPKVEALKKMPATSFPLDPKEIEARQWGWKTAWRFPLALGEDV